MIVLSQCFCHSISRVFKRHRVDNFTENEQCQCNRYESNANLIIKVKSLSPVSISRSSSIQFTNRAVYNLSRVTVAVVSISQNTDIHLPSPLLRPARATCIHLAWLTLPPWSNIIAMELVSNVQTSIKSLCHKGLSRGARARSNAAPLSTPSAREKNSRLGKTAIPKRFTRVFVQVSISGLVLLP